MLRFDSNDTKRRIVTCHGGYISTESAFRCAKEHLDKGRSYKYPLKRISAAVFVCHIDNITINLFNSYILYI